MNTLLNDQALMAEALREAEKGLYTTGKNPRVGCVVVKDGVLIGRGYHLSPGKPHAEVAALSAITDSTNATVYVNLEPCSHHGKTPPCAEALVAANVSRVVVAMQDPNPLVNGKGLSFLQNHGIETTTNILENEASELNKGFVSRMTNNRPYITVKTAISLDGKTALNSGESKWISGEASRKDVQKLRAKSCAILTGIETVLNDDPMLTVRLGKQELGIEIAPEQPKRIILDTQLRIPPSVKILNNAKDVIIYTCSDDKHKIAVLNQLGAEVVKTSLVTKNVDLNFVMNDLAGREINEVLVEAGSTLIGSLFEHALIDELIVYMSPHIMGEASFGLAKINSIKNMQDRIELEISQTRIIGTDLKLQLKPKYN